MATKKTTKSQRPELSESAGTGQGRDITRGYVDGLPYITATDTVLSRAGGYQGYEKLLQDDQVSACFAQRRHAVVSRPWSVTPGGSKRLDKLAAQLVEDTLKSLDWDTITDHMLYARHYGYAVAEVLWCIKEDQVRVKDIRVRDRRRFVYAPDFSLRLLTMNKPDGEILPEQKFWFKAVGASHADEPYGLGLGHVLYWPVWFKHNGARFWAVYLEKFAAPTALGEFPRGTDAHERWTLLNTLQAISTDAGIIVPEGTKVSLLEAARGGNATYESWMAYWDSAIAKIILGQTMTTEDGSSYSQASVHYDVRQDLVAADADFICQSANNSWVRWLVDYNFPGAAYPQIWRDMEDSEDLTQRVTRDKTLFDMGYRLKPDAVARIYGDDYEPVIVVQPVPAEPDKEAPASKDEPPSNELGGLKKAIGFSVDFAEQEEVDPIGPWADRLNQETQSSWQSIMRQVEEMVDNATSLPALRDQLLESFSDLPAGQLSEVMALAFTVADLAGRYHVEQESYA